MAAYVFLAFFTKSKVGATPANAPTVDVLNTATDALVVTAGSPTALANMTGLYKYTYTGAADLQLVATFKTTDATVDLQHLPSYTPAQIVSNLDAPLSDIPTVAEFEARTLPAADYTIVSDLPIPPTAAAIADAVLDEALGGHTTSDTVGGALNAIGSATVTVVSPVASDGTAITLIYGDDYYNADGRALAFTGTNWPTLTGGTATLRIQTAAGVVAIVGTVTGAAACRFDVTKAQVESLGVGVWGYDLEAALITSAHIATLAQGYLTVAQDVR
jgi:hypothetical protein